MNTFRVCICKEPHADIEIGAERKIRMQTIAENQFTISSDKLKRFVDLVGKKGYPFCPASFTNDHSRRDTFQQTQLFALTFSSENKYIQKHCPDLTFEDILCKSKQYQLPILFAYQMHTWYVTQRKFCVVFLNETPLFSLKEAEVLQEALMTIFPEADRMYSGVIDLRFGGFQVLHLDMGMPTINLDMVLMNLMLYLKNRYGQTNYKRKMIEFADKTGILLDDRKCPRISVEEESAEEVEKIDMNVDENSDRIPHQKNDKNSPCPSIYIVGNGEKLSKLSRLNYHVHFNDNIDHESYMVKTKIHQPYRSDIIATLGFNCRLYHEFESVHNNRKLSFQELFGIATNLARVEAGGKTFQAILGANPILTQEVSQDSWKYYLYLLKNREPYPCNSFCPYCRSCSHGKNILSTCKLKPHQIERVGDEEELFSLKEAHEDFEYNFYKAVESSKKAWHIIQAQTAIGKTQTILKLLQNNPELKVLIAVPTNKLKREVENRARDMGIYLAASPSLHEIAEKLPEDVWNCLETRFNAGKPVMPYIAKVIQTKSAQKADQACRRILKDYLKERDAFYGHEGSAVTTHRRIASVDLSKYDLVIIDEDYIFSTILADRSTIPILAFRKLRNKLPKNDVLREKTKRILKHERQSDFFILDEIDYDKGYDKVNSEINLRELCAATHFCRCEDGQNGKASIAFTKQSQLPSDVKYIMLSATASKEICAYCFGEENVQFYACKKAELCGTINQYYEESMSRNHLKEHPERFEQIKAWSGCDHTITFKKYIQYCTDELYFGNCVGSDTLKGEDIDVIGTPHQPEWIYKLFAFSLGLDTDGDLIANTIVEHNGYRFRFATFDNEWLRRIQFYVIETDLEQAVGRARLLRCDATVNVFSNFPLSQAILRESDCTKNRLSHDNCFSKAD